MGFVEENINEIIENKRECDSSFRKAWDESREEYRLIGEMTEIRKANKISQKKLAEMTGSRQQMISRMEKKENVPTLRSFCNILNALGYELKIVKQQNNRL